VADDPPNTDPFAERMKQFLAAQQKRIDDHNAMREGRPYQDAIALVDRLIVEYGLGINAIELAATRDPGLFEEQITLRIKQHFVQSMIAASSMIKEGLHDPAKREMRFLVEASVKSLWLDSGCPAIQKSKVEEPRPVLSGVAEKVAALDGLGRERFSAVVDSLKFGLLDGAAADLYRQTAKSLFSKLSTTTHISSRDVARDLSNFDKGRHFAFETVADVNAITALLKQVLDFALASHFEAFDHDLVGDIFEPPIAKRWSFLKTPLVSAIDRHFDYKAERQSKPQNRS
jgi:hypothetical protein